MEETSEKRVFVGYRICEKGYMVFNLRTRKVIVSRSIIFDEKALWNWEANEEVHISIPWDSSEDARITEGEEEFESQSNSGFTKCLIINPREKICFTKTKSM